VVLSLLFFGGRVIHDFAFALLVGIVAGSYSSIFVVAPLLVEWEAFMRKRRGGGGEVDSKGVASPAPATPDGVSSSTEREKSPQPAGRASRAQRRSRSRRGR
jgi:hypothetical protein